MSQNRRNTVNEPVVDDFPVRPNTVKEDERASPDRPKTQQGVLAVFSLIYFLYGSGISIYGPLYPAQARKNGLSSCIYGSVIATSHLVCILFYPVACHIVSQVPLRNSLSVSIFVIGACRILFGTLDLISEEVPFIAISYAVQVVEGIGISILIASTVLTAGTRHQDQIGTLSFAIQSCMCLGLALGPIVGEVVKEELGFDIPFYIIGGLTILSFILSATLMQEPEEPITFKDMPIIYWMKNKTMLIYLFIAFASFTYVGFLSVSLELILRKFHLNSLYFSMVFSLSPFVYGLTFPGWTWLINKGFNNVMLVFFGAIIVFVSLILLGPAPFTSLEASLTYVCSALFLEGLGLAGKSAGIMDALEKDLRHQKIHTAIQQKLIVPAVFMLGATLGYFCGSLLTSFMDHYVGYRKATLPFIALEFCTAVGAVVFAMNRNYISRHRRNLTEERQPILSS